ncbi:MAG: hypothetical protein JO362_24720 [Streptomycetaceae bacterium]|nr:hypothetical protein [Streptomycetaceae bacterium]
MASIMPAATDSQPREPVCMIVAMATADRDEQVYEERYRCIGYHGKTAPNWSRNGRNPESIRPWRPRPNLIRPEIR